MSEITENTFTSYLGPEFQQRLMWQILVEPEFAEKTIPNLAVEYFDDPNLKRLFLIILDYIREYDKVPNLQNQSILQAVNKFKTPNNVIEEESLFSVIERIKLWNERVLNKSLLHDGDVVQKATTTFIKQQEYRKVGEYIISATKSGEIKNKHILGVIDDKIQKISHIGDEEDYGTDVTEGIEKALRKEFRKTIPTGVEVLDSLTGGGLGKGEIGLILTPSGVGKTTLLTKIANTAREMDYNVLQIIFEDTVEQIQRKHFCIWTGIALSDIDDNNDFVLEKTNEKIKSLGNNGRLIIKKFSQEDTTMKDIRAWMVRYQKKWGFKFDILVLDYLDCLDSHKKSADRNEAELVIVKSFEALASDFDIPCWSAIQSNRSGFDAELVEAHQSGGNIKRVQKAHFFMSVAKTPEQKEAHLANIRIIKARFAQDGQTFKDCIFNNNTMQIIIRDDRYPSLKNKGMKKYGDAELDKLEKKTSSLNHGLISDAAPIPIPTIDDPMMGNLRDAYLNSGFHKSEGILEGILEGISDDVNDGVSDGVKSNDTVNDTVFEIDINPQTGIDAEQELNNIIGKECEKVIFGEDDGMLDWSGETFTSGENYKEVKLEDFNKEEVYTPKIPMFITEPIVTEPKPAPLIVNEIVPVITIITSKSKSTN